MEKGGTPPNVYLSDLVKVDLYVNLKYFLGRQLVHSM